MKKMFNIPQNAADSIYAYSYFALVVGAIITLIATIGVMYSGPIRERYTNMRIADNERQTMVAKTEAAKANENAAVANEIAAKSNLRAAEVEKQNAELRIKFSNRRINEKQHETLVNELSKTPSVFNIETMGDPESGLYAADILNTFIDSKWTVKEKSFPLGVIWTGLIIYRTNDPAAIYVADAFKKAGINFSIGNEFREKVTIMVGGKPPVF